MLIIQAAVLIIAVLLLRRARSTLAILSGVALSVVGIADAALHHWAVLSLLKDGSALEHYPGCSTPTWPTFSPWCVSW